MPRLKTRFVIEFEYDTNPDNYDGVTDLKEMAVLEQAKIQEKSLLEKREELRMWMSASKHKDFPGSVTINAESEVIHG